MPLIIVATYDFLYCFGAVPFVWYYLVRQFMMNFPAFLAAQPPNDNCHRRTANDDYHSAAGADYIQVATTYRTGADFFVYYTLFPRLSFSSRYFDIIII